MLSETKRIQHIHCFGIPCEVFDLLFQFDNKILWSPKPPQSVYITVRVALKRKTKFTPIQYKQHTLRHYNQYIPCRTREPSPVFTEYSTIPRSRLNVMGMAWSLLFLCELKNASANKGPIRLAGRSGSLTSNHLKSNIRPYSIGIYANFPSKLFSLFLLVFVTPAALHSNAPPLQINFLGSGTKKP